MKAVISRRLVVPFFAAVLCLAQANWQAVTSLPGVDWKGVSPEKKTAAMRILQADGCTCGCTMKIAECRVKDSACGVSRKLANTLVKDLASGKDVATAKAHLKTVISEPPPVMEDAVPISLAGDPVRGPEKARLTIVEFSDFQCPYCSKVVPQVAEVLRQFPRDVHLVFKQFPLDIHSDAEAAAEAALAAQAQGKFWEMHDLLYAGFPDVSRKRVMTYAKELKLDMNRFTAEMDGHKYKAKVLAEENEGQEAGVTGTPTFFFNGRRYNGNFDVASVVPLIKKELAQH